MKQICNGYCSYYYLTKDGRIYNENTREYKERNKEKRFILKTEEGTSKKVALKPLYKLVYNENYCEDNIVDLEGEEWKAINNTNNLYFVSNKGRVKSKQGYEAIILKPNITTSGYYRVDIVQEGKRISRFIHRLVAASFLEMPEHIEMQLHHKDCNKSNNSVDNIEWLTIEEHIKKHKEKREENINANTTHSAKSKNTNS